MGCKNIAYSSGIPVTYKAGDQPNNALSLNVLEPGEIATTGTSGVIYAVTDKLVCDKLSRVNTFAHEIIAMKQPLAYYFALTVWA